MLTYHLLKYNEFKITFINILELHFKFAYQCIHIIHYFLMLTTRLKLITDDIWHDLRLKKTQLGRTIQPKHLYTFFTKTLK